MDEQILELSKQRELAVSSSSPDRKALGLAFPEELTSEQELLLENVDKMSEQEFVEKVKPVVLMTMMQLHGEAGKRGELIGLGGVESFEVNIISKPGRKHKMVCLPSKCAFGLCTGCAYAQKPLAEAQKEPLGQRIKREKGDIDRAMEIVEEDNGRYLDTSSKYHQQHPDDKLVLIDLIAGGSILSPRELTPEARRYLWGKIREYAIQQKALDEDRFVCFATEARVDDFEPDVLKEMYEILQRPADEEEIIKALKITRTPDGSISERDKKRVEKAQRGVVDEIEIGWGVERVCHPDNLGGGDDLLGREVLWYKMMPPDWEDRVRNLKNPEIKPEGIDVVSIGHVMLTVPGETEAEGIDYASASIKELFDKGLADKVVLMAPNKRAPTVPGVIQSELPSVFSMVEVLKRLRSYGESADDSDPNRYLGRLEIRGFATVEEKVEFIHANCDICRPIEKILKDWRVEKYDELMEATENAGCECRKRWQRETQTPARFSRQERAALLFDYFSKKYWRLSLQSAMEAFEEIKL